MRRRLWPVVFICLSLVAAGCTGAKPPAQDLATGGPDQRANAGDDADAAVVTPEEAAAAAEAAAAGGASAAGATGATAGRSGNVRTGGGGGGTVGVPGKVPTTLFTAAEDKVGFSKDRITMCAHAALVFAAAFNTSADDLNVFWTAVNREKGGVFGRQVDVTYEDDVYNAEQAIQAATRCKAKNPFILLGGIGFDQIPAVRNWAEQNRMLYLHHTATVKGSEGKQFSFTALPSTEKMGEMFGELAAARFKGKQIGIIRRNSPNWDPGVDAFKEIAKKVGLKIVAERTVQANQGNYNQEVLDMKNAGAEVVWGWDNAIAALAMVRQAKAQQYHPTWMLFPFNLTSQGADEQALNPKLVGIAMFTAYSKGDYSGPFAPYAADIKEFETQYAKYRPNADLEGVGGDLLFLNWTAQKAMYDLLIRCGPDCGRNKFIDTMLVYKHRPFPASCEIDFTRPGLSHLAGHSVNVMETYKSPSGKVNWRNTDMCVEHLER